MVQPGQFLEKMMANLQSYLGPQGAVVTPREKFYNPETGKQIGEIDVTLRGDFGTSKFFYGLECRDRPADGPQGLPWIREIVGKKEQLKPDKMIAISSTGFTDDAIEFASDRNIDLITIAAPSEDIPPEWLRIITFSYTDWRMSTAGPVTVNPLDPARQPPLAMLNFRRDDLVFMVPPSAQPRSLGELQSELLTGRLADFDRNQAIYGMELQLLSPLSLVRGGQIYPLRSVVSLIDLVPHVNDVTALLNACRRLSDNKIIALTGRAEITIKEKQMTMLCTLKKDRTTEETMSMRIHYYDLEGNETSLPEGILMQLQVK
jgi:Restriction endonuclease